MPHYLYQKVFILAVGNQPALQPGETATHHRARAPASGILTLEVPPDAVPYIEAAQETGTIYLSLVTADYVPAGHPAGALRHPDAARRGSATS